MTKTLRRSLGSSLAFLRRHRLDLGVCALLCAFSLWSRLTTLEPVELSGDPLDYWYFVKQWFYGGEFGKFDHHDARFGIHIWLFLVQATLGEGSEYIYVAPLCASTAVIALSYVLTRMISTRAAAIGVCAFLVEYDPFIRASSQIRPGMFSAMYALAASIALVRYARAPTSGRFLPMGFVVGFLMLAYLTNLANLFLTPAVFVAMYASQRKWKDVAGFAGLLLLGFLAETALHYAIVRGTPIEASFGRGSGPVLKEYAQAIWRLTRYLDDPGKLVFYPFFAAGPALLALHAGKRGMSAAHAIVLLPAAYLLCVTFGVRHVEPLRALMPFHPRYLDVIAPHCMIATVVVAQIAVQRLVRWGGARASWASPAAGAVSLLLAASPGLSHAVWLWGERAHLASEQHPFVQARRSFAILSDAYARGLPIVGPSDQLMGRRRFPRSPPLHWAFKGFIRSELLVREDGKLPRFDYRRMTAPVARGARDVYLPNSLAAGSVLRARRAGVCVVELRRHDRFVSIAGKQWSLPERCGPLARQVRAKGSK